MDIHTDENSFEIPLGDFNFVKLKVLNRNNRNELSYLEGNEKIIVNLGNLNEWPKATNENYKIRHVKLEIEYTILNTEFKSSIWELLNPRKRIYYRGAFSIKELIQPEFYITLPRGLRIKDKGKNSFMLFGVKFDDKTFKDEMDESDLNLVYSNDKSLTSVYMINNNVYIGKDDKKESYSYLVSNDDYKIIKKYNKKLKSNDNLFFGFNYQTSYDRKLLGTLVSIEIAISLLVILRIHNLMMNIGNESTNLPFIIAFISYIALLLKYHDEEYNLPIIPIIGSMALIIIIWALFEFYLINPPSNIPFIFWFIFLY